MTKTQQNTFLRETMWEKIGNFIEIQRSYLVGLNSERHYLAQIEIETIIDSLHRISDLACAEIIEPCKLCGLTRGCHTSDCKMDSEN